MSQPEALVIAIAETFPETVDLDEVIAEIVWRLRAAGISEAAIRNSLLHYPERVITVKAVPVWW